MLTIRTRNFLGAPLLFVAATQLTACMHINITDKEMIRPDSATGYKSTKRVAQEDIQKISAAAVIKNETVVAADQGKLEGISLQQEGNKVTVLYFGGNLSHVDDTIPYVFKNLEACKINLVSFDYRGYGRTAGAPDSKTLQQDALTIYDAVRAKTQGKLIVHGHSMGSFSAGYIASQRKPDGIILEATGNNIKDMATMAAPWYFRPFINLNVQDSLQGIDNVKAMSTYQGPSLVFTGEKDAQTPAELGQKVYEAIPSVSKRLVYLKDQGHTGMLKRDDVQKAYCDYVQQVS
ncbi:alpha/beta hydrolase [Undibacterium sp. YM2]|uniref:alpha/beta hydrolase n=1 Tax=Undibacterium sp. YM2 TaxID=2058625 RepID=UPI001331DA44|nr:alpha/beta fold hydrolase [Undibacterium sp. YM2]BBB64639.1 alpha/beta hydrolase [Undibacterium sp. YM2]